MRYAVLVVGLLLCGAPSARACPFCEAPPATWSDDLQVADAAVIVALAERPAAAPLLTLQDATPPSIYRTVHTLRGEMQPGIRVEAYDYEDYAGGRQPVVGQMFLLIGVQDSQKIVWGSPKRLSPRAVDYVRQVAKLSTDPSERLPFFWKYLEDPDDQIAQDAYGEFAKAPYGDLTHLKEQFDRTQLLRWILAKETLPPRRTLYVTLLGICGTSSDAERLQHLMNSPAARETIGLDALLACYLKLQGAAGLPRVEELFLQNPQAEYSHALAAAKAIRFVGNELDCVPRPRLAKSLRLLLRQPALADIVIADLSRWEDWEAMPQVVALFQQADGENSWVRGPIIKYLQACPLPAAEQQLTALRKIDPQAFQRLASVSPFGPPQPAPE